MYNEKGKCTRSKRLNDRFTTKVLVYCAICVALAVVTANIKLYRMPQGGSVCLFRMFFISLAGFWFGPIAGIITGCANGLLELVIDPYVIHPAQFLFDYILAFCSLGISGFFRFKKHGLYIGYLGGVCGRFFFTWLSGVIFFAANAPVGQHAMIYSFEYNAAYFIPEVIGTVTLISIPAFNKAIMLAAPKSLPEE